jgi:endonuclease YncB( thermonuclease family)
VTVHVNDQDRWGRYIARVAIEDGRDVGKEMIQAGLAWHYKHFDKSEAYAQAEQTARDNKRGLWSDPRAVAPWEFRKRRP